ncbi:hypothetical protein [Streptacidiphilus fuscans]|uniref:Uncharacterized protein n=1 Tax=Streptacidiphilus fuscans TaxID=2789292 RepID=A0A931B578_9ACTN|nr:hypothetical protein [Streptacidiphilus fuscans]MBF9070498.1 hypothetical protein [Streptacidiphilus fuscans]
MTTDTNWSDWPAQAAAPALSAALRPGQPQGAPLAELSAPAGQSGRRNRLAVVVLASLVVLATVAVGLVVLLGATASAAGGCGGG